MPGPEHRSTEAPLPPIETEHRKLARLRAEHVDISPIAVREGSESMVAMNSTSSRNASSGDDDGSWRTEGIVRARMRDVMEGSKKVGDRLSKFSALAVSNEFLGGTSVVAGVTAVTYGIVTIVGTGLTIASGGLVAGGLVVIYFGYKLWKFGRCLANRVDGVACRIFERQAKRRTKDYFPGLQRLIDRFK